MKKSSFSLLIGSALGLAACSGSTDPATANLFDNIYNLRTGEYDRQIAAKDAEAAAIISNNRAAQSRISGLEAKSASNKQAISELKKQIAAVRGEASAARGAVAGDPAKLSRLNALVQQINAVQSDVNNGGDPAVARVELKRVSAAIRALAG